MTFASALVSTTSDATEAATARPATSKTIFVRRFIAGIQIHGRPRDQGLDMGLVALAMQNVHRPIMDFGLAGRCGRADSHERDSQATFVIPGRAQREPGIHNHDREYGFRACAKWRIPE